MSTRVRHPEASALVLVVLATGLRAETQPGVHWPSFRGPGASGIAEGFATPTRWDVSTGQGIQWRSRIPGLGHSSPVIWGNRLFVTTASRAEGQAELRVGLYGDIAPVLEEQPHRFELYCLDKRTGKVLWSRVAHEGTPEVKRHPKSSHANPTPATDGNRVLAFFGSEGLFAYDMEGRLLWRRDFGVLESAFFMAPGAQWGFASSPVVHDGKVIIQVDVLEDSFLAVLDAEDGRDLWRVDRDDVPTWSTPTIHAPRGSRAQILVNGFRHIGGYDLETGDELWRLRGGGDIPVPTPVPAEDLVFITGAHGPMAPIYAVRLEARGDISLPEGAASSAGIAWSYRRDGAYMQTPLAYGGLLYVCRDNGVLSCYDAGSGERRYRVRLGDGAQGFSSSAVAADGKIYFTSEHGEVHVVKAGPRFEELAVNDLGAVHMSTPAISEGTLFFRTRSHLVAIAREGSDEIATPPSSGDPSSE